MKYLQLAKSSSLTTAILFTIAGLTAMLGIMIPSHIFGFLLAPAYLVMIVCIYHFSPKNKIEGLLSILFSVIYVVLVSFNYSLLFTFHGRGLSIPELLQFTNPDSIFLVIEVLAYYFMGLSTLVLIPVFGNNRLGKNIKILFLLNGILGIGGVMGYALDWNLTILFVGLMLWNIVMPIASLLVFFYFKKLGKTEAKKISNL